MVDSISVILPALNEGGTIGGTLQNLEGSDIEEVIVVDGGSADDTVAAATALNATVLSTEASRGRQQNLGARHAKGSILLFLHCDTALPEGFEGLIRRTLQLPGVSAGAFRFKLDSEGWTMRLVEWMVDVRCRLLSLPYGDQAIFVSREVFDAVGGFSDLAVMEDFDLIRRLRKLGGIAIADGDAVTSSRRWRQQGVWSLTLRHQLCVAGYFLGVPPARLERWRGARGHGAGPRFSERLSRRESGEEA